MADDSRTSVEKLHSKLYDPGGLEVSDVSFFLGATDAHTAEEVATELLRAITAIEDGDFDVVEDYPEGED